MQRRLSRSDLLAISGAVSPGSLISAGKMHSICRVHPQIAGCGPSQLQSLHPARLQAPHAAAKRAGGEMHGNSSACFSADLRCSPAD